MRLDASLNTRVYNVLQLRAWMSICLLYLKTFFKHQYVQHWKTVSSNPNQTQKILTEIMFKKKKKKKIKETWLFMVWHNSTDIALQECHWKFYKLCLDFNPCEFKTSLTLWTHRWFQKCITFIKKYNIIIYKLWSTKVLINLLQTM